jgi:hypothetical protein
VIVILTYDMEEAVLACKEHMAGNIIGGCRLGGAGSLGFMCLHDLEGPKVQAWPADVDAGLLVRSSGCFHTEC